MYSYSHSLAFPVFSYQYNSPFDQNLVLKFVSQHQQEKKNFFFLPHFLLFFLFPVLSSKFMLPLAKCRRCSLGTVMTQRLGSSVTDLEVGDLSLSNTMLPLLGPWARPLPSFCSRGAVLWLLLCCEHNFLTRWDMWCKEFHCAVMYTLPSIFVGTPG